MQPAQTDNTLTLAMPGHCLNMAIYNLELVHY